ncbi:MAG: hypothetical protein ACXW0Z_14835 [Gemmatirosa sp.]
MNLRRALLVLAGAGALGALVVGVVLARSPGHRMWAVAAMRSIPMRLQLAQVELERELQAARPPAELRCAPARTVGAPGELLPVDSVPAAATATALFMWPDERASVAARELRALREIGGPSGLRDFPGRPRAAVLTADGTRLRAARRAAPTASVQLAVAGTTELCFVAS